MNKNEKVILGAACFFAGAVAGVLISPIKNMIYCGKSNGNTYGENDESNKDELEKVLDKVLDEVNEAINNTTKEENEEPIE